MSMVRDCHVKPRQLASFSVVVVMVTACAAPGFRPSTAIEDAAGPRQALMLCNEYQPAAPMDRPVSLRPFVTCLDEVTERFSASRFAALNIFHRELQEQYSDLKDESWTEERGRELTLAIRAALRGLWQDAPQEALEPLRERRFTESEKEYLLRLFPRTAEALRAGSWKTSPSLALEPRLERLHAALAALADPAPRDASGAGLVPADSVRRVAEACKSWRGLRDSVDYLDSLWRDQWDMNQLAPGNAVAGAARERFEKRLENAFLDLQTLRERVEAIRPGGRLLLSWCGDAD